MAANPHPILVDFERRLALGPTFAARVLGLPYISYAQYRAQTRELKHFHKRHIEVILLLPKPLRDQYIGKVLDGTT